jgi:predicted glutamine amidotransferase
LCGLVGMMGAIGKFDRVAFHWLLHLDVIRGDDSTGICAVHNDNSVKVFKEVGRPEELYDKYEKEFFHDYYQRHDVKCLIGHNRAATQGEVNAENAHPFEYKNIIGAHNGTIIPWSLKNLNGFKEHQIDSQIVFQHINDTNNVQEVWDTADGAMALTWWDKDTKSLNVARNEQRPLHYCLSKDEKVIFWASKPWMLEAALARCGVKHKKIVSFDTNVHYKIFIGEKGQIKAKETPLNPFVDPWASYTVKYNAGSPPPLLQDCSGGYSLEIREFVNEGPNAWDGYFIGVEELGEEVVVDIYNPQALVMEHRYKSIMKRCEEGNPYYSFFIKDLVEVKGYPTIKSMHLSPMAKTDTTSSMNKTVMVEIDGEKFDETTFKEKYSEGCCLCGSPISFDEVKDSVFVSDLVICKECKDHSMVQDWLGNIEKKEKVA